MNRLAYAACALLTTLFSCAGTQTELPTETPTPAEVVSGYEAIVRGDYAEAAALLETALQKQPDNLYALVHLGLAYQQLGRTEEAIDILEASHKRDPERTQNGTALLDYYLGLAYEDAGRDEDAVNAYERDAERDPTDPLPRAQLGALYERRNELEKARKEFELAAQLDPSNETAAQNVERVLRKMLDAGVDPFPDIVPAVRVLETDAAERIENAPHPDEYPNDDAVILFNRLEHEILSDGRARFTTHLAVKILRRRAIADYGEIAVPYNSAAQHIRVNKALTRLPDGTVMRVQDDAIRDATPRAALAFNLYSDTLWKVISFPALMPGAVVEYQVTVEDAQPRGSARNIWFWNDVLLQAKYPTLTAEYGLRMPEEVKIKWKAYRADVRFERRKEDGNAVYIWSYGPVPPYLPEPNSPPAEETAPRLTLSSVDSWDAIHTWYRSLLSGRADMSDALAKAAGDVAASRGTQEERIQALCAYAARELRYVAIQLGQGAYQPHTAVDSFERRYGDCKDKTNLLISALSLIGVEALPAILNPTDGGADVDKELPSLSQFSHMILALPTGGGEYRWFDPTNDALPVGRLPARNQGRMALILAPSGPIWRRTPIDKADSNRLDWTLEAELGGDGSLEGVETLIGTGLRAGELRRLYRAVNPSRMRGYLEERLSGSYPGAQALEWSVEGLEDVHAPVQVRVHFRAKDYARVSGGALIAPIPGADLDAQAESAALQTRKTAYQLGVPAVMTRRVRLKLPDGFALSAPPPRAIQNRYASFKREYSFDGQTAQYDFEYTAHLPEVPPEAYPPFKRLLESLAQEENAVFLLERRNGLP